MIFDFTANRVIFALGMVTLFAVTSVLANFFDWYVVLLLAFIFVVIVNVLMKRVAQNAYQYINTLLFVQADAKGYLERIEALYRRGSKKRRQIHAVKLQNLVMAHVFSGDYDQARDMLEYYKNEFKPDLETNVSMRISQTMVETLIHLFDYDETAFETSFGALRQNIEQLPPETRKGIEENPYSIYYMISKLQDFLAEDDIDVEALQKSMAEMNEFLRTCTLHVLTKTGKVSLETLQETEPLEEAPANGNLFERAPGNTLFFKDATKVY